VGSSAGIRETPIAQHYLPSPEIHIAHGVWG